MDDCYVSIPQAVGTIAIGECISVHDLNGWKVSIPQAVGTIAISTREIISTGKGSFQYRKR